MKRLYLIGGTMGVGKTAVCQGLKLKLDNSVFLDGDWCWDANPFQVTEETKTMVMENICFLLNQFIHCSAYHNIIFCWVMHEQSIIDKILDSLDKSNCEITTISLPLMNRTAGTPESRHCSRHATARCDRPHSVARIPLYHKLNTIKIDTTGKTVSEIAEEIARL